MNRHDDRIASVCITIDEPLSPGTYELRVDDPRSGSFETRVEVFAGETTEVRVELPPDNR